MATNEAQVRIAANSLPDIISPWSEQEQYCNTLCKKDVVRARKIGGRQMVFHSAYHTSQP